MKVIFTKAISKDVRKIKDARLIQAIADAIINVKEALNIQEIKNIKFMKGYNNAYRIKIGGHRLGFYYDNDIVILSRFLKREDNYKHFPKK